MGLGVVGLEAEGGTELGDRTIQLPLTAQGVAEIVVGLGKIGLEAEGGAERGDRLFQLPLTCQDGTEIVVDLGKIGLEAEGGAERGDRLFQLPLIAQGCAEVHMGVGKIGLEAESGTELGDRLIQLPPVWRANPRLEWAMKSPGSSSTVVARDDDGLVEDSLRISGPTTSLQHLAEAGDVPPTFRAQALQVLQDGDRLDRLTRPLECVSQSMRRLGPERSRRHVVTDRLLAAHLPLQAACQRQVQPDITRIPPQGLAVHRFRRREVAQARQCRP